VALIDKPTDALGAQREKQMPVIAASELKAHLEVPSVQARLTRVQALAAARTERQRPSA
jgi:hypothetical protein